MNGDRNTSHHLKILPTKSSYLGDRCSDRDRVVLDVGREGFLLVYTLLG